MYEVITSKLWFPLCLFQYEHSYAVEYLLGIYNNYNLEYLLWNLMNIHYGQDKLFLLIKLCRYMYYIFIFLKCSPKNKYFKFRES